MSETINFRGADKSEYSIRIDDGSIELDWYFVGSMQGGAGTEGGITVGKEKVSEFLNSMNFKDLSDFINDIKIYDDSQWSNLKEILRSYSTGSWSWSESD